MFIYAMFFYLIFFFIKSLGDLTERQIEKQSRPWHCLKDVKLLFSYQPTFCLYTPPESEISELGICQNPRFSRMFCSLNESAMVVFC